MRKTSTLAKYLRSWGPAAAWAAVLFLLSSIHGTDGGPSVPFLDKIAHFVLYAVLGGALARGRSRAPSTVPHAVLLVLPQSHHPVADAQALNAHYDSVRVDISATSAG